MVLGALCAAGALLVFGESAADLLGLSRPAAEVPAASTAIPESNQIARQAQQWGIERCIDSIAELSTFLTRNADYSWRAQRGASSPDRELFSATVASPREQGSGILGLSTMFAAPAAADRCNAGYQTTLYFPQTCQRTREAVFSAFSVPIQFGNIAAAFATADGRAALYMLPAGPTGCVAVKSELFY